ncbi:MAG: RHS repeat-associated core domain-containing protein [Planctomycetaceae bacterium]
MLLTSWLRSLAGHLTSSRTASGDSNRRCSARRSSSRRKAPTFASTAAESLETRQLLAAFSWNTDSDGAWDNAANWIDGEGNSGIPAAGDSVTIDRGAANPTITISSNADVTSLVTTENIVLLDGRLKATEEININGGTLSWRHGTVQAPNTNVGTSGTIETSTELAKTFIGHLHNSGNILWQSPVGIVGLAANATFFTNEATGVWIVEQTFSTGSSILFTNAGMFRKTTSAATAFSQFDRFDHRAGSVIEVTEGMLQLTKSGTSADPSTGATFDVATGAIVDLAQGDVYLIGTYTGTGDGRIELSQGIIRAEDAAGGTGVTFDFAPGLFHFTGGEIRTDGANGDVFINAGEMTWSGSGTRAVTRNGFHNAGTIIQTDDGVTQLNGSGTMGAFYNDAGALFEHRGTGAVTGFSQFLNSGTVRNSAGDLELDLQFRLLDGGRLESTTGRVLLSDEGYFGSGTIDVAAGSVVELNEPPGGGYFHILDGATLTGTGAGRVEFTGGRLDSDNNGGSINFAPGLFHWVSGDIYFGLTNIGEITIPAGGTPRTSFDPAFTNRGTVIQEPGSVLAIADIFNDVGGLWVLQDDAGIVGSNGFVTNAFRNAGTLRKTGPGTSVIDTAGAALSHQGGTVEVLDGNLTAQHHGNAPGTGGHFVISAGSTFEIPGTFASSGTYTGEGGGTLLISGRIGTTANFVTFDFPQDFAELTLQGAAHFNIRNTGHLTLANTEGWQGFFPLINEGTITQESGVDVLLENGSVTRNYGVWELVDDATISLRTFDGAEAYFSNFGTLRKTGVGTAKILHGAGYNIPGGGIPHFNNVGTVEVLGGELEIESKFIQQFNRTGETLAGGNWYVGPSSTLKFHDADGNPEPISTLLGSVTLDGAASSFPNIDSLAVNGGTFTVTGGRDFAAVGDLANGLEQISTDLLDAAPIAGGRFVGLAVHDGMRITHPRNDRVDNEPVFYVQDVPDGPLRTILQPGGPVNVSGIDITTSALNVGGTVVPAGTLLFIHANAAPATLYAIDPADGTVISSVALADVGIDQVGVAHHPSRSSVFVLGKNGIVTEVNTQNGSTVASFPVRPGGSPSFSVSSWGGIDIDNEGRLLIVGSSQARVRVLTSGGVFQTDVDLTYSGMARQTLSDISYDDATGEIWLASENGFAFRFSPPVVGEQGSVRVGAGSTLTVNGDYTQSGSTTFGFAGSPASGLFGSIVVTGAASFAGDANFVLENGFAPGESELYNVMTFTSKTGDLTFGGDLGSFDPFLDETVLRVNSLTGAADLAIESVTVPASGVANDDIIITYTGRNLSGGETAAAWTDSIYLSADTVLDASDVLIARGSHSGALASGTTYTESVTAVLPGAFPANYHVIVVADSRGNSPDVNRSNNTGASANTIALDIPSLTPGVAFNGTISSGQDYYFRVDLATDETPSIKANFAAPGAAEMFVRQGQFPNRTAYDHYAFSPVDQSITVSQPAGRYGTYYILIHGTPAAGDNSSFSLVASGSPFGLTRLATTRGANSGPVTTLVKGSLFTQLTTFELVSSSGTTLAPVSAQLIDSETAWLTFDLTGIDPGLYDLRATQAAEQDVLADAFEVVVGNEGRLVFDLNVPAAVRSPFRSVEAVITYQNVGDTDLIAPIFTVVADNARMRLPDQLTWSTGSIEVMAINPDGPAGVLPPGATGTVHIRYEPIDISVGATTEFTVTRAALPTVGAGEAEIEWDLLRDDLKPPSVNSDAWQAIFDNFKDAVGDTYESYLRRMAENATYLASIGLPTSDVGRLMQWEFQKAGNFGQIEANHFVGVFGQQPFPLFDSKATIDADQDVTIAYGSSIRGFVNTAFGYLPAGGLGTGTVTVAGDGTVRLTEFDGSRATFRAGDGRLTELFDPRRGTTTIEFNAAGRAIRVTEPNGDVTAFAYNAGGKVRQVTDAVGRITTLTYNSDGLQTSRTDQSGTLTFTYTPLSSGAAGGAIESVTYTDGTSRRYEYNSGGQLIRTERVASDGSTIATTYSYSSQGAVTATDADGNQSTTLRGPGGVAAAAIDSLGNISRTQLSPYGYTTSVTGPNGATATFDFGNDERIDEVTDIAGNRTTFGYDTSTQYTRLTSITDARGATTEYGYDAVSNLTRIVNQDGSVQTAQYDSLGNRIVEISAAGERIEYTYDAAGQLTRKLFLDGSSVIYTYDAHRNLLSASQRDAADNDLGTTSFTYDSADRVLTASYPNGTSLTLTYDAAGRRTSATDQTGASIAYRYDGFGRLIEVLDNSTGTEQSLVLYQYDALGRTTSETRGNGTRTVYGYDALSRVVRITHSDSTSVLEDLTYTYDQTGHVRRVTSLAGDTNYEYDIPGQLTKVSLPGGRVITYGYDADGNRTVVSDNGNLTTYAANLADQYQTVGSENLDYDGNGSLTSLGSDTTFEYDREGRLISATSGATTVQFEYDALGNRIASIQNGVRTDLLVDPGGLSWLFGEYKSGGDNAVYARGNGIAARITGGNTQFYHYDLTGNTQLLTDGSAAVSDTYQFLPFGEIASRTGSTANPFTFNARDGITETGIADTYSMRNRNYSAELGRFLESDPIKYQSGETNHYRFAANDPVTKNDPTGLLLEGAWTTVIPGAGELGLVVDIESARYAAYLAEQQLFGGEAAVAFGEALEPLAASAWSGLRPPAPWAWAPEASGLAIHNGEALTAGELAGPAALAFSGGWVVGRGLDNLTDYTHPQEKNNFREALNNLPIGAGPAGGGSPIYEKGGVNDSRYNEFQQRNMRDPLINATAKRLIRDVGLSPTEALERAQMLVNNYRRSGESNDVPKKEKSEVIRPRDPNNIIGPAGYGGDVLGDPEVQRTRFDGFIRGEGIYPYEIHFENKASATAPAQTVWSLIRSTTTWISIRSNLWRSDSATR